MTIGAKKVAAMGRVPRLAGAALLAAACVGIASSAGPPEVAEAESGLSVREAASDRGLVAARCATGQICVRLGGKEGGVSRLELHARSRGAGSRLWLRLACHERWNGRWKGASLRLVAGESFSKPVEVADTLHLERFEWIDAAPLPEVPDGAEIDLGLEWLSGAAVDVDQWAVLAARARPDPAWSPRVWIDGSEGGPLEVRECDGASVFDGEWVMKLLRESRDDVALLLGASPPPLFLFALRAGDGALDAGPAFQNRFGIFVREDELHLPWRSYAHEISHVFEEQSGVPLPWFLSEGIAGAVDLVVTARRFGREDWTRERELALDRLLVEGDAFHQPGAAAVNPAFLLQRAPADADGRRSAYEWSTALVFAAARTGGDGFFRRLHAGIAEHGVDFVRDVRGERDGLAAAALAGRVLSEAAGADLAELFRSAGLPAAAP